MEKFEFLEGEEKKLMWWDSTPKLNECPTCVFIVLWDLLVLLPLKQEAAYKQIVETVQNLGGLRVCK